MAITHTEGFRTGIYRESPWYWPIEPLLARLDALGRFPLPEELSLLHRERVASTDVPALRFVAATKSRKKRPRTTPIEPSELYEGRVTDKHEVPTRVDDWHDLFNALSFIAFPRAKRALHARLYRIMRGRLGPNDKRLPNARTREQDALALFDEGGLCIAAPASLCAAMHEVDDVTLRAELLRGSVRVVPFGHALYEHLVARLPCPFGAAYVVPVEEALLAPHASVALLDRVDRALGLALADPREFLLPSAARGNALSALA